MAPIKRPMSIKNTSPVAKILTLLHCAPMMIPPAYVCAPVFSFFLWLRNHSLFRTRHPSGSRPVRFLANGPLAFNHAPENLRCHTVSNGFFSSIMAFCPTPGGSRHGPNSRPCPSPWRSNICGCGRLPIK